jgi:hypothetical protein
MEISSSYVEKFQQPPLFKSQRDELIAKFLGQGIQLTDRKTKQLRPVIDRELVFILGHIPTADLHAFYRQCEGARSFGRYFWWAIKPKKV